MGNLSFCTPAIADMPNTDVGIGMILISAPLYLTELVPASFRGRAIGFCAASFPVFGIIATTTVWQSEKLDNHLQYQIPLAVQAALPCLLGIMTLPLLESPTWCMFHGHENQSAANLSKLRPINYIALAAELASLRSALAVVQSRESPIKPWDILRPGNLGRTLTAGVFESSAELSGAVLMQTYATVVLVQSGLSDPFRITILITCVQLLGTMIGPILVDKIGRRPLVLCDLSILCVLNVAAGSLATTGVKTASEQKGLAAIFIIFAFFYAIYASV